MNYPNTLTIRPIDRSLANSYGVGYYCRLSDALIERAAAQLKLLNEVVKPQSDRGTIHLVLGALLMAFDSIAGRIEEFTDTLLFGDDEPARLQRLLSDAN